MKRPRTRPVPRGRAALLPFGLAALVILAGLLGSLVPIPGTAVGESLDPAETLAARRAVDQPAQALESERGQVERVLRSADIQQLIGPATACTDTLTAECGAQLAALGQALGEYGAILAQQPAYEAALRAYDRALMAQTRALGGAGEPLREATWPLVGAAAQLDLLQTKYGVFFEAGRIEATRSRLTGCAAAPTGTPLPAGCRVAPAEALKIGQVIEARAAVGDAYRRALIRYQRALDERIALIFDETRPRLGGLILNGLSLLLVALGAWFLVRRRERGRPVQANA